MFKIIRELFGLLTQAQRKRLYRLQALVIFMAFFELAGLVSIIPFMSLVGDMSLLEKQGMLADLYHYSGLNDHESFIFWLGIFIFILLTFGFVFSMFATWRISLFAARMGGDISNRLYSYYMRQGWLYHANSSSAQLTKQIANETLRITQNILTPMIQMNAKLIFALVIITGIFLYHPQVAMTGLIIFSIIYFLLYKIVREQLQKNGQTISNILTFRYRLMNNGFGGIKDILLLGRKKYFFQQFEESSKTLASSQGNILVLMQVPKYLVELIAFGSIIALILYLFKQGNLGTILPILSVYAIAGLKLLPVFQHLYASASQIKANLPAYESIRQDLFNSQKIEEQFDEKEFGRLDPKKFIELKDISFTYPGKDTPSLDRLTLKININQVVGIVGPSGSGKSTAIDMLAALIDPDQGELRIDNQLINAGNKRLWQNVIGFVPQMIFLSEGSIAENVAFGISPDKIDFEQVEKSLKLAHLDELVTSLPKGLHTDVGERGVKLSGGQRQRIGIARAMYHDASVMIFDEATSALDGITERMIMEAIHEFHGTKTIIMIAHRLKTVEKCDMIYFMDQGRVVDQGNYSELIRTNSIFQKMAEHS